MKRSDMMIRAIILVLALLAVPAFAQQPTTTQPDQSGSGGPGLAVDASGNTAVDPSENAKALVEAHRIAEQRYQDDIRELEGKLQDEKIKRLDDMRGAEAALARSERQAAKELAEVRFSTLEKLADLDREAVAEANRTATEDAKGLALTVQQTAEDLRGQNDTATAAALAALERAEERIVASLNGFDTRLTTLEQGASVSAGRGLVADPALVSLQETVEQLASAQDSNAGRGGGQKDLWGWLVGGAGLLLALLAFAMNQNKPRREV